MAIYDPAKRTKLKKELRKKMGKSEPEEKLPSLREALWLARAEGAAMIEDGFPQEMPQEIQDILGGWLNARMQQIAGYPISGDEERILALCPPPETKDETNE